MYVAAKSIKYNGKMYQPGEPIEPLKKHIDEMVENKQIMKKEDYEHSRDNKKAAGTIEGLKTEIQELKAQREKDKAEIGKLKAENKKLKEDAKKGGS